MSGFSYIDVVSKSPLGYLEVQTLRNDKMSGVTPKAARVLWQGRQDKRALEGPNRNDFNEAHLTFAREVRKIPGRC